MTPDPAPTTDTPEVAIVTGGGRGIGAATVRRLARAAVDRDRRLHLIVNFVDNVEAADEVVAAVDAFGPMVSAAAVRADVSSDIDVQHLFERADAVGPVTMLVNNAAVVYPIGPFIDIDADRLERSWAVNITGAFLCAREAVRRMSTDRGGSGGVIVNVSSRAASFGSPNEFIDYAASKGALDTMTRGLANEVAGQGIRVNAVRPGLIDTDIHTAAGQPDRVRTLAANVPMKRGGTPEEVADLIVWLLSPEASYMTGALVDVGGGR